VAVALDTSVVYAYMDGNDADHEAVSAWIDQQNDELVTTPLVLAEIDYLVSKVGGRRAAAALRNDLEARTYAVDWWPTALAETLAVAAGNDAIGIGLVDASLVALAARLETTQVATLDERHFRTLVPLTGEPAFALLPADA
jgi:uncharacterized protein